MGERTLLTKKKMTHSHLDITPRKILVIKPSSLGDVIHSLPFLNSIRKCFPQAEIHWVIAKEFQELPDSHPMIDKLWVINKGEWKVPSKAWDTLKEVMTLFRELKKERFDITVDLQGLLRSGLITMASGAKIRIGLKGFKEGREGSRFFYTHRVSGGKFVHAVERYMRVADFLGCDTSEIKFPLPDVSSVLPIAPPYAVIVPGARWQTKKWRSERFGELASMLPIKSLVIGTNADDAIADEIVKASKGNAVSLTGKTNLKELIGILKNAMFVVSTDSGPMHIASALSVPVFALFGTTSPLRTGPYGDIHTIITAGLPCAPCFKKRCDDLRCMDKITVEMLYNAIKEKIKV
ncbi:MAG: glycosyltransferase family 9 protein [Nitrospirae bacterium]|nr:glycosyltransferase family 9 protein [Nitrospirota bacterium]